MERLRRKIRGLLGWNSWPYRFAASALNGATILVREGPFTLVKLNRLRNKSAGTDAPVAVKFRRLDHPFLMRPGTQDVGAAISIIVREEYGQLDLTRAPHTLIDAGAYTGDTTAYFLSRFPEMTCIALEPNPESYALAERNLAPYGQRVTLLPCALSASERPVFMTGLEMGAKINGTDGIKVEATTISKILERLPEGRVDILKLDIEGAENEIFLSAPEEWLDKVDCIVVETHGDDVTRNVLGALQHNGWQSVKYRNLYYCRPAT